MKFQQLIKLKMIKQKDLAFKLSDVFIMLIHVKMPTIAHNFHAQLRSMKKVLIPQGPAWMLRLIAHNFHAQLRSMKKVLIPQGPAWIMLRLIGALAALQFNLYPNLYQVSIVVQPYLLEC